MNLVPAVSEVESACVPTGPASSLLIARNSPAITGDKRLESEHNEPQLPSSRLDQRFLRMFN